MLGANSLSGMVGAEEVPDDQDSSAAGEPADEIRGSIPGMAGEAADAGEAAARAAEGCKRTFRRYVDRYEDEGLDGLMDKCLGQVSARRAPVDGGRGGAHRDAVPRGLRRLERQTLLQLLPAPRRGHAQLHVGEEHVAARGSGGQGAETRRAPRRGRRRERSPLAGMMLHQDGSTHQWVPGQHGDLVITLDDTTSEHYHFIGPGLADILCEHHESTVGRDNCVSFGAGGSRSPPKPTAVTVLGGRWRWT